MGRQHPDKSLENALHRIVKQRTLATLSMKNVAFVLEHQDDTLDDLTEYLRARRSFGTSGFCSLFAAFGILALVFLFFLLLFLLVQLLLRCIFI